MDIKTYIPIFEELVNSCFEHMKTNRETIHKIIENQGSNGISQFMRPFINSILREKGIEASQEELDFLEFFIAAKICVIGMGF
jgi:hypothetical protein